MSEIVIKGEGLGKKYIIAHQHSAKYQTFREKLVKTVKSLPKRLQKNKAGGPGDTREEFWSLRDLNFEITQGDVVGIIGRNGAGKSTLLKLISRITEPTTGRLELTGRVASLLEVGTGFHPELTGRENIFLNGVIFGMTQPEIRRKFDEIVDFSGVEQFLDTPVKRYSSGMYVRLAFAVAAHLEPEILVVDEVLAVGDVEFQNKCLGKMKDVSQTDGRTVLFVSHNMAAIQSLCDKGLYLERGGLKFAGSIEDTMAQYFDKSNNLSHWRGEDGDRGQVIITETYVQPSSTNGQFVCGEELEIGVTFRAETHIPDLWLTFTILSPQGAELITVFYNDFRDIGPISPGTYQAKFRIPAFTLAAGGYRIEFNVSLPFIKRLNSNLSSLSFEMLGNPDGRGDRYFVRGYSTYSSVVRPDWLLGFERIS
jgi:lipopolysaccharide transport system ATP-binding protein